MRVVDRLPDYTVPWRLPDVRFVGGLLRQDGTLTGPAIDRLDAAIPSASRRLASVASTTARAGNRIAVAVLSPGMAAGWVNVCCKGSADVNAQSLHGAVAELSMLLSSVPGSRFFLDMPELFTSALPWSVLRCQFEVLPNRVVVHAPTPVTAASRPAASAALPVR